MPEVALSSPDRVLFPEDGITKGDLFEYYGQVAGAIVPHLKDRPFTMKRYPHGITQEAYFQKQAPKGKPQWTADRRVRRDAPDPKPARLAQIQVLTEHSC